MVKNKAHLLLRTEIDDKWSNILTIYISIRDNESVKIHVWQHGIHAN